MLKTSTTFLSKQRGLFFFILIFLSTYGMAQPKLDWLRTVDYIPMHTGFANWWFEHPEKMFILDTIKNAGIDVINVNVPNLTQMDTISNAGTNHTGLKVIVGAVRNPTDINQQYNFIAYYTDAKYSVWEAEAEPGPNGDAVLLRDQTKDTIITGSPGNPSYVRVKADSAAKTFEMIYGPYYRSEVVYYTAGLTPDDTGAVKYLANFRLKLEHSPYYPNYNGNPSDTICRLRIQYSNHAGLTTLGATYAPRDTLLRLKDFTTEGFTLNQFQDHPLEEYNLTVNPTPGPVISIGAPEMPDFPSAQLSDSIPPGPRRDRGYMQYKVIWLGKPQYLLSVDKVTIYDKRGKNLLDPTTSAKTDIINQAKALESDHEGILAGWLAVDEPTSIDCYEPFRIVQNILDSVSNYTRPLWIQNMGRPLGTWEHPNNQFGAMKLSPWTEFKKRVGHANLWQDFYYFDYPYTTTYNPPGGDYRDNNITAVGDLNYKQAYNLDPGFGVSIQAGENHHTQSYQRQIYSAEVLYEINLALMYGAKFINFWMFIAANDPNHCFENGFPCHAIIDLNPDGSFNFDTGKYKTVRDTISPRLKGLFGITIKKLIPTDQYVGRNGISYHYNIPPEEQSSTPFGYIEDVVPVIMPQYGDFGVDLGFFHDSSNSDKRYFMVLNRSYSNWNEYNINLKDLNGYKNWHVTDFRDTSNNTIQAINNHATFVDTIVKGDAGFYSLFPVVKYGGNLLYNDTLSTSISLTENELIIKNGATLVVNSSYNIYKDITVELGGQLKITSNGSLNFYNNAKLKVYGTFTNTGTSTNKVVVNFNHTNGGVILYKAQNLENLSIQNSNSQGIYLDQSFDRTKTTVIKNCEFLSCSTGVAGTDVKNIIVQSNYFYQCSLAAMGFTYSSKLYILSNNISYCGYGLSLISAIDIKVRHNQINNCGYGINLGNSTITAGDNIIYHSDFNGIYAGFGSFLNIRSLLRLMECSSLIFDRERGWNTLYDNYNVLEGGSGEGAEIYLNNAVMLADSGSNIIYDDRTPNPETGVINVNLIDGYFETEPYPIFSVSRNDWGDTTSFSLEDRFGSLDVNYYPTGALPLAQNTQGCFYEDFINTSVGPIILDTLYAEQGAEGPPDWNSYLSELYQLESDYRADSNFTASENTIKYIIDIYLNTEEGPEGLSLLYSNYIERGATPEEFQALGAYYHSLLTICNSYSQSSIEHYEELCLMQQEEYQEAMASFQNTINQYPGTERADLALIDLYTAALLDSTQQLGKSLVKVTTESYNDKIKEILLKKLGKWEGKPVNLIPTEYMLFQNYPNPFNPSTTIRYAIKERAEVKLIVYDILGRVVKELVNEVKDPGYYDVKFSMNNYSSGVYFYSLQTKNYIKTNKMLLIK